MTTKVSAVEVKPGKLTDAELDAWDRYASSFAQAALTCWFRWKQGVPVDQKTVLSEACALADTFIAERRKR